MTADCHWELIGDTQNSERRKNLVNFPYFLNIGILWRMGCWSLNVEKKDGFSLKIITDKAGWPHTGKYWDILGVLGFALFRPKSWDILGNALFDMKNLGYTGI